MILSVSIQPILCIWAEFVGFLVNSFYLFIYLLSLLLLLITTLQCMHVFNRERAYSAEYADTPSRLSNVRIKKRNKNQLFECVCAMWTRHIVFFCSSFHSFSLSLFVFQLFFGIILASILYVLTSDCYVHPTLQNLFIHTLEFVSIVAGAGVRTRKFFNAMCSRKLFHHFKQWTIEQDSSFQKCYTLWMGCLSLLHFSFVSHSIRSSLVFFA